MHNSANERQANMENMSVSYMPSGLNRTYGVIFDVWSFKHSFRVNYEICVKYKGKLNEHYLLFELNRQNVFINSKLPESLIDQLAASCGEVVYPLDVITGLTGDFMGINNKKDILQRWAGKKEELSRFYIGEKSDEILYQMDIAFSSDRHLVNSIFSDQFIALYFSKVIQFTRKSATEVRDVFIPLVPYNTAVQYSIEQYIDYAETDNGTLSIIQKGDCTDPRGKEDIDKNLSVSLSGELSGKYNRLEGALNLTYSLYRQDGTINSITGNCTLELLEGKRNVSVQIFHLREKDLQVENAKPVVEEKKRRGFFSFLDDL